MSVSRLLSRLMRLEPFFVCVCGLPMKLDFDANRRMHSDAIWCFAVRQPVRDGVAEPCPLLLRFLQPWCWWSCADGFIGEVGFVVQHEKRGCRTPSIEEPWCDYIHHFIILGRFLKILGASGLREICCMSRPAPVSTSGGSSWKPRALRTTPDRLPVRFSWIPESYVPCWDATGYKWATIARCVESNKFNSTETSYNAIIISKKKNR